LSITQKLKLLQRPAAFYVISLASILFAVAFNSCLFFEGFITRITYPIPIGYEDSIPLVYNYTYYYFGYTYFALSDVNQWLVVAQSLFRDLILMIVLVVINTLILFEIKKSTQRRIQLANHGGHTSTLTTVTNASVLNAVRAERRRAKLIVLSGLNYFFGHFGWLVYDSARAISPRLVLSYGSGWLCHVFVCEVLIAVSYTTPFFFYYFFNTQFKKFANGILRLVFYPIVALFRMLKVPLLSPVTGESNNSNSMTATAFNKTANTRL
jgi:hypothetical protein